MNVMKILANPNKQIKATMQKARRRVKAFSKAIKEGKLTKENATYQDVQEFLKNSPKEFRRYNRHIGAYEPITPRGKLKESDEFADFYLELNQKINTGRNAMKEMAVEYFKKKYKLSNEFFNKLERMGYDYEEQTEVLSETTEYKQVSFYFAMNRYNKDDLSEEGQAALEYMKSNIDNYSVKDIYEGVFHIFNNEREGVFSEI